MFHTLIFYKYYSEKAWDRGIIETFSIRNDTFFERKYCEKCGRTMVKARVRLLKKIFGLLSTIILIVIILLGAIYLRHDKVNMDSVKKVEVCFQYGNADVMNQLSDREAESVKTIFNEKRLYKDNFSCGFSEAVSIKFDDEQTFCIARDTCPIVYWEERNRYIRLTEDEKTRLYNLLEPYGFVFPCV